MDTLPKKETFIKNINEEEIGFHETPKSFNNIETSKKIIYNEKIKKIEEKELTEAVILILFNIQIFDR